MILSRFKFAIRSQQVAVKLIGKNSRLEYLKRSSASDLHFHLLDAKFLDWTCDIKERPLVLREFLDTPFYCDPHPSRRPALREGSIHLTCCPSTGLGHRRCFYIAMIFGASDVHRPGSRVCRNSSCRWTRRESGGQQSEPLRRFRQQEYIAERRRIYQRRRRKLTLVTCGNCRRRKWKLGCRLGRCLISLHNPEKKTPSRSLSSPIIAAN